MLFGQLRWYWGCGLKVLEPRATLFRFYYFKCASRSHAETGFLLCLKKQFYLHASSDLLFPVGGKRFPVLLRTQFYLHGGLISEKSYFVCFCFTWKGHLRNNSFTCMGTQFWRIRSFLFFVICESAKMFSSASLFPIFSLF